MEWSGATDLPMVFPRPESPLRTRRKLPRSKPPIPSTKSTSVRISTIIWTQDTRARLRRFRKPSFETFLSSPVTLSDHLHSQLALVALTEAVRDAAEGIIGNLDENGYLTSTPAEIAASEGHTEEDVAEALRVVHTLDPAGVGAADLRECLLLQLESRNAKGGVAWNIVADHLKLVELKQWRELARVLHRPQEHIDIAINVIRHLDPRPGLRYSGPGARQVEPDVYITKDGEDYLIQINDEDLPVLRLNPQYRKMLDRDQEPDKDVRNYVKERYASAIQLMKNIEQRKHTDPLQGVPIHRAPAGRLSGIGHQIS